MSAASAVLVMQRQSYYQFIMTHTHPRVFRVSRGRTGKAS
jgi:hypothetical protein